jgi:hypothetical protein
MKVLNMGASNSLFFGQARLNSSSMRSAWEARRTNSAPSKLSFPDASSRERKNGSTRKNWSPRLEFLEGHGGLEELGEEMDVEDGERLALRDQEAVGRLVVEEEEVAPLHRVDVFAALVLRLAVQNERDLEKVVGMVFERGGGGGTA